MLHRVILGAVERFLGVLIEHTAGALPTWLSPVQARILIVTDAQKEFAEQALARLKAAGIRAELDDRNEKLGFKVREAQGCKDPTCSLPGDKEKELGGLNVRAAAFRGKSWRQDPGRSRAADHGRLPRTIQAWRDAL